jgi:glycosyltransferase involved in cell wall biosynthesis
MSEHGLVSVVIPAFNAERYLGPAIESVLTQTYSDLELVVVDDGSTDGTASVVEACRDSRVRLLRQSNAGVGAARNRGLEATTGSWVGFLDADDMWFPAKLERQLTVFAAAPELRAVGCLMEYVSDSGGRLGVAGVPIGPREQHLVAEGRLNPFPPSAPLFRRAALTAVGGYDETLAASVPGLVEDLDVLSKVARSGPIWSVPTVLGAYRLHDGSASARHFFSQRDGIRYITALRSSEASGETLNWEQFRSCHRRSLWELRTDVGAYCYRRAGLGVAGRDWSRAALYGVGSLALAPGYSVRKLLAQRPWSGADPGVPGPSAT